MHKLLGGALCAGLLLSASPAVAHHAYGDAGCGLGSLVFKTNSAQTSAASTNGTGSQFFAITSGTSNCADAPGGAAEAMRSTFVSVNSSSLQRDAAAGNGEYLATWSLMLGCETNAQSDFFAISQANHDRIFTLGASPEQIVANFKTIVAADAKLAPVCKL